MNRLDEAIPSPPPEQRAEQSGIGQTIQAISRWVQKKITRLERKTAIGLTGAVALHAAVAMTPLLLSPSAQPLSAQVDPPEIPEVKLKTDQEIIDELYERDKAKVAAKARERGKRIDPEASKAHRQEVREQIEARKPPLFFDFLAKKDIVTVGIEPETVERGQNIIEERVQKLRRQKGKVPIKNLLVQLSYLIYDYSDDVHPLDLTCTDTFEYVVSQVDHERSGNPVCTSCQAKWQTVLLYLEKLFPEYRNSIFLQELDKHLRTGIEIAGKKYAIDGGAVIEVTRENKAGTYLYKPIRILKVYAGLPVEKLQKEPGPYPTGKPVRYIKDDTKLDRGIDSNEPLRKFNDDPAGLYGDFNKVKRKYQEEYQRKVLEREQILTQESHRVQPFFELTEADHQTLSEEAMGKIEIQRSGLRTTPTSIETLYLDVEKVAGISSPSPDFVRQLEEIVSKDRHLPFAGRTLSRPYELSMGDVSGYNPHILTSILNLMDKYQSGGMHFRKLSPVLQQALSSAKVHPDMTCQIEIDLDQQASTPQIEDFFQQKFKSQWYLKLKNPGSNFRLTPKIIQLAMTSTLRGVDFSAMPDLTSEEDIHGIFIALQNSDSSSTIITFSAETSMKIFESHPESAVLKTMESTQYFFSVIGTSIYVNNTTGYRLLPARADYLRYNADKENFIKALEFRELRGHFRAIIDLYETYYFLQHHDSIRREEILRTLERAIQFQETSTSDGEPRVILEHIKEAAKNFAAQRGMN